MGFFDRFIALVLSHLIGIYSRLISCFIQRVYTHQLPEAMYSASVVESATEFCFLLNHETSE